MCGINGFFAYRAGKPPEREELLLVRDHMTPRGPDGCGAWWSSDGRTALAHRRLAIIDLSEAGAQPMSTSDGRFTVTFNGEIYNYRELRRNLESDGVVFRSHSDTEVLLHLYRSLGQAMVKRLRGMFAFAIWDAEDRVLFMARDPYGIKPFYYADDGTTFRFASQVKALRTVRAISSEIDSAGITGFFLWGSVPEPFTLYREIHCLPAGHTMIVSSDGGVSTPRSYWDLADVIIRSSAAAEEIAMGDEVEYAAAALRDSVRAHMVADVPVGAFLSAGLDSSTVVGLAQEMTDHPLQTITLAFDEFKNRSVDEAPAAIDIARHLGVAHQCVSVSMRDVEGELGAFLSAMDQPTIDGINTWFVSKAVAEAGLKVALSGVGGDELLGGYRTFHTLPQMVDQWAPYKHIPFFGQLFRLVYQYGVSPWSSATPKRAGLALLGGDYPGAYQIERGVFMPWELHHILRRDVIEEGLSRLQMSAELGGKTEELNGFGQVAYLESTCYLRNQLLRDTDWVGMAHSLEIRVPLVDSALTESLIGLAASGRLGKNKAILPASLAQGLPKSALERPKTGFTVPIWKWLRKSPELADWKRIKHLQRPNIHDYNRWSYSVMSRVAGAKDLMK